MCEIRNRVEAYLHRSIVAVLVLRRHTHGGINRWWWSGAIWSTSWTRVVLTAAPAETDTRIPDRISLHLIDGHLCCMTLYELDEATALARWDLDVGNFAEALEEGAQFVFSNIARQTTNEDRRVVRIGELVHRLRLTTIVRWHRWAALLTTTLLHVRRISTHLLLLAHHWIHATRSSFVLRCSSRDAHRSVAAVDALHLTESTLLIGLVGEADKTVATRHSREGVGHDLGRLAGGEATLE